MTGVSVTPVGISQHSMPAQLFETQGNPAPEHGYADMLTMPDGKRIRYARFAATGRPLKGTVIIIPGRNECIEKYFETIADLSRRGFGTAIFDLRGQGASDRLIRDPRRGYIDDFMTYVSDIDPFFEQVVLPDCRGPFYVLAHSTGALIALLATPVLTNRIQRMVLSTPLLSFHGLPFSMDTARRISGLLHAVGLGSLYLSGSRRNRAPAAFDVNVLTSDARRYARNVDIYRQHPSLGIAGATASWVRAACIACERVRDDDFIASLKIPVLIVAAGADTVVDTSATERYSKRLRTGTALTIDGARHELLQEADIYREQFFAAFDAFIPGNA